MLKRALTVGPFQCNCRILACPRTGEAIVVDPGDEPQKILAELSQMRTPGGAPIRVKYLFHTHGHLDHIAATRKVSESLIKQGVSKPIKALHQGDDLLYRNLKMQGDLFNLTFDDPLPIDHYLQDEEILQVGDLKFSVIHTPGHSPGSVCLRAHEDKSVGTPEALMSGDTLFQGSVGRTDLWGADQDQMFKSIHGRILTLNDDTLVWPGHGADTLIGIEKQSNPFLQ